MRKPVYLAILGISVVVAAVSLGVTLTRYLGLLAYSPKGTTLAAVTAAGPGVPTAPPEEWNNLFAPGDGMELASRLPAVDPEAPLQASHTNFVLVGTITSSSPSARRAVLWTNGMNEAKAFREKEEVAPGAFLASVERDVVWITRGGVREKLELRPVEGNGRPGAAEAGTGAVRAARPSPDRTQSAKIADKQEELEMMSVYERRRRARAARR